MKANTYIGIIILAGFVLIGYLYSHGGATQIPAVIVAIGVLCKLFQTDAKVELTTAKVDAVKADQAITNTQVARSIDVSTENAHAIAAVAVQQGHAIEAVSQQVADNTATTDETHKIVNSQRSAMLTELAAMRQELAALKQANAIAETSESRIIAAVERGAS